MNELTIVEVRNGSAYIVECDCGARWIRPAGDDKAETLSAWAGAHVCEEQQRQLFA